MNSCAWQGNAQINIKPKNAFTCRDIILQCKKKEVEKIQNCFFLPDHHLQISGDKVLRSNLRVSYFKAKKLLLTLLCNFLSIAFMSFRFHSPAEAFQPFIQGYLEADYRSSLQAGEQTLFPNGFSGIFFNFGNLGKLLIKEEFKIPFVSVFGQIDRHFVAVHCPGYYSLGVLLKPTVLSWLLKVDMPEFTNRAVDGQLIAQAFGWLHQQMEETTSFRAKIHLFENYFGNVMARRCHKVGLADRALTLINQRPVVSVHKVAEQLCVSQRHLEIQFKQSVGLSPKTYLLILRFKRMEQQLKNLSSVSWQEMKFAHEYYDQNHFIKDFKRFTGHTPSDYLLNNLEMGRSYLVR
jgi:AraC-like DNA-binding protein